MKKQQKNETSKIQLVNSDIGRWVTVIWDDVGKRDCLIVDFDEEYPTYVDVFEPYECVHRITPDQIVEKRQYVNAA